jgi:hypothetical protein
MEDDMTDRELCNVNRGDVLTLVMLITIIVMFLILLYRGPIDPPSIHKTLPVTIEVTEE